MQENKYFQIDGIFHTHSATLDLDQAHKPLCTEQCRKMLRDFFGAIISLELFARQGTLQMLAKCPVNNFDLVVLPFEEIAKDLEHKINAMCSHNLVIVSLVVSFCVDYDHASS